MKNTENEIASPVNRFHSIQEHPGGGFSRRQFLRQGAGLSAGLAFGLPFAIRALAATTVEAPAGGIKSATPILAKPLPLTAVRLTGGPLKRAQDVDRAYLLSLDPDRMMAYYRRRAGLKPKAEGYGGWDGDGRNLTGHIAGHYLSAVSLMYAATGDARFKQRASYIVSEMALVQNANGNGYLGALMADKNVDGEPRFEEIKQGVIESGGFDLNGLWSPWYVQHKIFAGLRDAYRYTGNRTALAVSTRLAAWTENIVGGLTPEQDQKMLATEFGGMNEVMADLYADTRDHRWLAVSDRFEHLAVRNPLAEHKDVLGGLHANCQIPKFIGSAARYQYTGNATDGAASEFFWESVVNHHSFATGGHGKDEYFGPADELTDRVDGRTDESCNVYNMLKLTRELFALNPDVKYAEFHERAIYNHALASLNPETGRMCYMVPVGRGVQHEYQDMYNDFTCCVGTGMENHALHGYGLYYTSGPKLWVNLYAPSVADWSEQGVRLAMHTDAPIGDQAALTMTLRSPKRLTVLMRRPSWAGEGFAVHVNGKSIADLPKPGSYVELDRLWRTGDTVHLTLPKILHAQPLPDNARRVALMWGPLVLSGDLGPERDDSSAKPPIPVFVGAERPIHEWLKPVSGQPALFRPVAGVALDNVTGKPMDVTLQPFYSLHERTYAAYWDTYTTDDWRSEAAKVAAQQEAQRMLDAATVAYAQPGEMQPERDFNEQGQDSTPDRVLGRAGRRGTGWFSFDMPVDAAHPMTLIVTYCTQEDDNRTFDILADGKSIGRLAVKRTEPGAEATHFYDVGYPIPADIVAGKKAVTIRFQAVPGSSIAGVYGLRTVRADSPGVPAATAVPAAA